MGLWRSIDDKTGEAKAEIRIAETDGALNGRIEKVLRKDAKPDAKCDECKDERKGQPMVGLEIIRGAEEGGRQGRVGERQDPRPGKRPRVPPAPDAGRWRAQARCPGFVRPVLAHPDLGAGAMRFTGKRDMYKEHELRGAVPAPANSKGTEAMNRFQVKKVAVLGAGVMGAQIAAHLVNVKVPVVLFDLPAKEGPKNGIVTKAVEGLKKLKPSPLGVKDDAVLIQQANYEEHLEQLRGCDLIIEAIAERMDWKLDLYRKIAPFVAPHAIVASNTSGLSITKLSEALPAEMKPRFCGIHFFNPPRYMYLVELINTPTTDAHILDDLETFVTSGLGKGVVRAKDTPNFIANRVGIAGMLATMREVEKFGLTYDVVDDLTGKKMGRASSGTFRTADIVGLDTMAHVIKTLQDTLSPADRSVLRELRHAAGAEGPAGKGQPGPEDQGRFLQAGGPRRAALRTGKRRIRSGRRQGRRGLRPDAEEAAGRAAGSAAQRARRAGPVPVGDPAQQLPLRGRAPGDHRRDRARRGLRAALGLRHEAGPVRAVAGSRLAAGGATGSRRT